MNEPTIFEEALALTLEGYKKTIIEEYDKALREAMRYHWAEHGDGLLAINEAKVEA